MQVIVSISATVCDSSLKQERVCVLLEQSKTLQLCLALRTHRTRYGLYQAEELVTHLPHLPIFLSTQLVSSQTPFKYFTISEEVHREEQKKSIVSATRVISETLFFILLTAHARLAASSFTLPPPSVRAGLFHIILCDAKQDHTTMSGECRWGCFGDVGCQGRCYSSLWRTGGSSLCDRAVRTLSNFS